MTNSNQSTSSVGDSPVSRSASLESEKGMSIHDGSGQRCYPSFAQLGPDGSWRKTSEGYSQLALDGSLESFSETWPRSGMTRSGTAYRLPPLAPNISAIVSGSWPTPTVWGNNNRRESSRKSGDGLATAVRRTYPTPTAIDAGTGRINRSESPNASERPTLALMARRNLWPTPMGSERETRAKHYPRGNPNLAAAVMIPAPTAQDAKNSTLPLSQISRDSVPGHLMREMFATPQAHDAKPGYASRVGRFEGKHGGKDLNDQVANLNDQPIMYLNADWVEGLMGFPPGWTELD